MKKNEKVIIAIIAVVAIVLLVVMRIVLSGSDASQSDENQTIAIYHRNTIVQKFDPSVDAVYTIEGDYGTLDVEVKDGKWRVTNEECPNHVCSSMGWVDEGEFLPITCIPNNVIVVEVGE